MAPRDQAHDEEVLRGVFASDGSEVFLGNGTGLEPSSTGDFDNIPDDLRSTIDHADLAQPAHHYAEAVLFCTSPLTFHTQ